MITSLNQKPNSQKRKYLINFEKKDNIVPFLERKRESFLLPTYYFKKHILINLSHVTRKTLMTTPYSLVQ